MSNSSTMKEPRAPTSEWTLWVVAAGCALHATEEYFTGWFEWAPTSLGIVIPAATFVFVNTVLVIAALVLARGGWRRPTLSLVIPAATLVNAVCFHIVPTLLQGRVSPGLYTAAGLYLPFSSWALLGAARDGVPRASIAKAFLIGSLVAVSVVAGARWQSDTRMIGTRSAVMFIATIRIKAYEEI